VCRQRPEAAVLALRRDREILFRDDKTDVVELERLEVDRFLNQISIFVADVLELF